VTTTREDSPARATHEPTQPPERPGTAEREETAAPGARPAQAASAFARSYAPGGEAAPTLAGELPATVSLTLEEAKTAIRAAGGDVIQVGFLASAYLRQREEEPESTETAAAREACASSSQAAQDRKLLAPQGRFELLEVPPARKHTA
jgi:hypothetical protein